ncbi:mitrocomin-like [Liolophura sinensis]|uniref:mitrocomin-like n=1 Tax=Liolophura sinensis TaxID=3198878 RepID=UPI0031588C8A
MIKKWEILFDYVDTTRDGIVDIEEMMSYPNRLVSEGKQERGKLLGDILSETWGRMCEANNLPREHASLTKAQWVIGRRALTKTDWFRKTYVPTLATIHFESLDRDHDNTITLDEWRTYKHKRGVTDDAAIQSAFKRLDLDGDGIISQEEMTHAITQFCIGEDPSDDYSFLYIVH